MTSADLEAQGILLGSEIISYSLTTLDGRGKEDTLKKKERK